jgi:hypothetical protein
MRILTIDAWREDNGYVWNNWFKIGEISKADFEKLNTNRKLIRYMRDNGYLGENSHGLISVDDDDQYNTIFCERSNGRPLFVIEYGPEY